MPLFKNESLDSFTFVSLKLVVIEGSQHLEFANFKGLEGNAYPIFTGDID